jgi:hypothetical protein
MTHKTTDSRSGVDVANRPVTGARTLLRRGVRLALMMQIGLAAVSVGATSHEANIDTSAAPAIVENPSATAISQLRLSDVLADFGERHSDPLALIEAAKLRKALPMTLTAAQPAVSNPRTWESLLRRAKQLSGDNPTIASLIADVRVAKVRDIARIGDDIHLLRKLVHGGSSDRAEVRFDAGQRAVVYVRSEAGAVLALSVYDEFNNLICTGDSSGAESMCQWRPRWNGRFLLDVHNDTASDVPYQLAINREIVAH